MKAKDIVVGGLYVAKVSNKLTVVKVDAIREFNPTFRPSAYSGRTARSKTYYDVTNTKTGRKTTFHSAAKFRSKHEPKTTYRVKVSWPETGGEAFGITNKSSLEGLTRLVVKWDKPLEWSKPLSMFQRDFSKGRHWLLVEAGDRAYPAVIEIIE